MQFQTPYKRLAARIDEDLDYKTSLVERAGYVPANRLISSMIEAGRMLNRYRSEQYDFPSDVDVDESFSDPTRTQGYDPAEGTQALLDLQQRVLNNAPGKKEEKEPVKVEESSTDKVQIQE